MTVTHFGNEYPNTFGWSGDMDPLLHPSLLVSFEFDGVSFGQAHRYFVPQLTAALERIVPLIPGGLIAGQCGCFVDRAKRGASDRSFHSWGIAADINWGHNPLNAPRPHGEYVVPDSAGAICRSLGLEWGGDWTSPKDWMHIETHLTPEDAIQVNPYAIGTWSELTDQINEEMVP